MSSKSLPPVMCLSAKHCLILKGIFTLFRLEINFRGCDCLWIINHVSHDLILLLWWICRSLLFLIYTLLFFFFLSWKSFFLYFCDAERRENCFRSQRIMKRGFYEERTLSAANLRWRTNKWMRKSCEIKLSLFSHQKQ